MFYVLGEIEDFETSYTVIYSTSGSKCDSTTIQTPSCGNKMCNVVFDISSSSCLFSDNVTVSVFASSILGSGSLSKAITVGMFHDTF